MNPCCGLYSVSEAVATVAPVEVLHIALYNSPVGCKPGIALDGDVLPDKEKDQAR